ncbi:MAG: RlmE family RNA methyltransferase [Betaproteobacteria bacterium]|nr:RlmE family RNA methyltransferase [Betaproteobacteria bacterium]NBT74551.1 RlmE family RNA methyltransferase [Betaproteobacteria bacterium]NBY13689.1 RlmE family RNA methyltransferase [Betaproteobacteria bacterium]NCA16874.1 RlmE family RNA methyltransferase [Betaproteobacteria bacterium]NDF04139.1 RlmE family RNA methyltransferase [Betaproteobacteria bacterium]
MAKNKFNPAWLQRHLTDPYVRQAQQRGYRSRAAFKLLEIDEKDRLIRPGMTIVDLGSAPGSWSQVIREKLARKGSQGIQGRIIALDLLPMDAVADVDFIEGDFREESVEQVLADRLGGAKADLVLSDMSPNLSGVASADAARIMHVGELALEFAQKHLKPNGALLVKTFQGSGYSQLVQAFKQVFERVASRKPGASRAESSELFLLGRDLKSKGQS